ncbi:MAG TPA: glutaminyl-peptide cyclotransferase, partial [Thermoanaerobaculia bacterium]|nr:glutaminyl-peptide cyclotransferase [Thermoanaerobaculia bacterium]
PPSLRPAVPERLEVRVLAEYPHDPEAFTQGLLLHDGHLYESTGRYGLSELRRVVPETGEVVLRKALPAHLFGEGLALVPGGAGEPARLVQLTWHEETALVWDAADLTARGELAYRGEGWGLAWDGSRLVMSDGSSWLTFRDAADLGELGRIQVTLQGRPLSRLNELEWADGALWANVWDTHRIVRIDPATGEVTGVADLTGLEARLTPEEARRIDVLNGIAWWPERGTFLVTGKLWPRLFEVALE